MNLQLSGLRNRGVYSFEQPFHLFSLFGYICNLVILPFMIWMIFYHILCTYLVQKVREGGDHAKTEQ